MKVPGNVLPIGTAFFPPYCFFFRIGNRWPYRPVERVFLGLAVFGIPQAANQAREELRSTVANLAVLGASQILEKEVDADTHRELLDKLIAEI